jgi:hypothetical protein
MMPNQKTFISTRIWGAYNVALRQNGRYDLHCSSTESLREQYQAVVVAQGAVQLGAPMVCGPHTCSMVVRQARASPTLLQE